MIDKDQDAAAALSINLVFLTVLLISVYDIGKAASSRADLLAALLVGTYGCIWHSTEEERVRRKLTERLERCVGCDLTG